MTEGEREGEEYRGGCGRGKELWLSFPVGGPLSYGLGLEVPLLRRPFGPSHSRVDGFQESHGWGLWAPAMQVREEVARSPSGAHGTSLLPPYPETVRADWTKGPWARRALESSQCRPLIL